MPTRFKLFALDDGSLCSKFIGSLDTLDHNQHYIDLRHLLEEGSIVDWPLQFWDHQDKVRIWTKVEKYNTVVDHVYAIPIIDASIDCAKCRRIKAFTSTFDKPSHTFLDEILDLIDHEEHVSPTCLIKFFWVMQALVENYTTLQSFFHCSLLTNLLRSC